MNTHVLRPWTDPAMLHPDALATKGFASLDGPFKQLMAGSEA